ncbi:DUF4139 domain-containing protein [Dysgonomonas sp. ZJ709]|uniref:DUF4139 domain-containing protein n=1 Tax=Dysgonomonas sp. ZJ709 TaxID=2709797 RepID=UPI0013EB37A6|nr:DUF4139 domain-containing protein [Dysgonomonas sp. ZJ709]
MKTKLLCVATLLLASVSQQVFAQDKKVVPSKLNEATVFFQGAELNHSATSALAKGENEIWIEGLSPNIDKNSLKIKTSNGAIISSYEYSVDYMSGNKAFSPIAKKLQDSISMYREKLSAVQTDITINENLKNLLQKGTDKNVAGSDKGLGIDELVKTMEYYKTKSLELEKTQKANQKIEQEIKASIKRVETQFNQESLKNNKTSGVLRLTISAPAAISSNFTITYYTSAAAWVPYYDINIASTDKPIKMMMKSKVRQTTGLDWEKVKLTLSTATPSNGKIAPLFSAWFLENMHYAVAMGSVKNRAMQNSYSYDMLPVAEMSAMKVSKDDYAEIQQQQLVPLYYIDGSPVDADYYNSIDPAMIKSSDFISGGVAVAQYGAQAAGGVYVMALKSSMDDYVTQADNDMSSVYNIDIAYTIPGNGKKQSIDLQTKETNADYKYYSAPKLDTETYLLAEISNWETLGLLSGKANITYDGTYVGETFINAASTLSKLALTLGTEKRVAVKREKMQDFSSTKFLGNDTRQIFTYKITVKNNQNKTIKMVVKDQYPISTQKNIEVELLKETTAWTANKEDVGVITWEEEFAAGETKEYIISYSVKYPKGSNLNL